MDRIGQLNCPRMQGIHDRPQCFGGCVANVSVLFCKRKGMCLGISPASSYELLHQEGFPTLKIGNRLVVPKEKFIAWVKQNTVGGEQ